MSDDPLQKLRDQIDAIDGQLLELFNQRAGCAVDIAGVKRQDSSQSGDSISRSYNESSH